MKMKSILILALTLVAFTTLFATSGANAGDPDRGRDKSDEKAGKEVGNGGNSVVCRDPKTNAILPGTELLDYYEAKKYSSSEFDIDLGDPSLGVRDKVILALKRLTKVDPLRASMYAATAADFLDGIEKTTLHPEDKDSSVIIDDIQLFSIPDSNHPSWPLGCKVEQTAIRPKRAYWKDKILLISKPIWDSLDNDGKAGLVLHETVYAEAVANGQLDSDGSRYLNAIISSNKISKITPLDYAKVLATARFDWLVTIGGGDAAIGPHDNLFHLTPTRLDASSLQFDSETMTVVSGVLIGNAKINPQRGELTFAHEHTPPVLKAGTAVTFYPDGNLKSGVLAYKAWYFLQDGYVNPSEATFSSNSLLAFYEFDQAASFVSYKKDLRFKDEDFARLLKSSDEPVLTLIHLTGLISRGQLGCIPTMGDPYFGPKGARTGARFIVNKETKDKLLYKDAFKKRDGRAVVPEYYYVNFLKTGELDSAEAP